MTQATKAFLKATPVNIANLQFTLSDARPDEVHITGSYQGTIIDQWVAYDTRPFDVYFDPRSLVFELISINIGQGLVFIDHYDSVG